MHVISAYTTRDAINDGVFVNLSDHELVKEHGFNWGVIVTEGVNAILQVEEDSDLASVGQSFDGRFHDLLTMAKLQVRRMVKEQDHFGSFEAIFQVQGPQDRPRAETIKFFIAVNDLDGKPVFTIMLPEEY